MPKSGTDSFSNATQTCDCSNKNQNNKSPSARCPQTLKVIHKSRGQRKTLSIIISPGPAWLAEALKFFKRSRWPGKL